MPFLAASGIRLRESSPEGVNINRIILNSPGLPQPEGARLPKCYGFEKCVARPGTGCKPAPAAPVRQSGCERGASMQRKKSGESIALAPLALALFLIAFGMCAAAFLKGPNLDEYWTIFYTDPRFAVARAWHWWSADTGHPVGFYALTRLFTSFLPQSVVFGRLFNLAPLTLFLWFALRRAGPSSRTFGGLFAVVLLGGHVLIERFAEHRPFFPALMLLAMLVVVVRRGFADRGEGPAKAWPAGVLAVGLGLFDYPSFAAGFALLTAAAVCLLLARRVGDAIGLGLAACAGIAAVALSVWNSFGYELVEPAYRIGLTEYLGNLAVVGGTAVLANVAVSYFALGGGLRLSRGIERRKPLADWADDDKFALCLVLAILFTVAGYTLLNAVSHAMVKRQLFGIVPLIAALIANLGLRAGFEARDRVPIVVASALSVAVSLAILHNQPNFHRFGRQFAASQRQCPTYRVFAPDDAPLRGPPRSMNDRHRSVSLALGYEDAARVFGFRLEDRSAPRRFDAECGGAIWMEHVWIDRGFTTGARMAAGLGFALTPPQAAAARLERFGAAVLVCVPGEQTTCGKAD